MADLTQTLIAASRADTNAEAQLNEAAVANYPELVKALAAEIANESKPVESRQMASLYLKNTLNAKSSQNQHDKHERWKLVDPASRGTVKDSLLRAMRSPDAQVARFAGITASEIACVELPYNEWPQFVPALEQSLQAPEVAENIKYACLECLGLTCERVDEVQNMIPSVPDLPETTVNSMLTAVVQGVQSHSEHLRFGALSAINKSLSFVHKNMERPQERDFILRTAIFGAVGSSEARVRSLAFQCLDSIADLYYDKLQDYMPTIYELTTKAIQQDVDDSVKMSAIEFWCTVAETEEEQMLSGDQSCKGYIISAMGSLVPLLLETLSKQADDMDEDLYDLPAAGANCLEAISLCVREKILDAVIPFVQGNIQSDNWRMCDAAIIAFSCVLDGPSPAAMRQYVQQVIPVLMAAFIHPNETVRDSATNCIATICKLHVQSVTADQVYTILAGLMAKLEENSRLAGRACAAIFNISTSLKSNDPNNETNVLSSQMLPLMQNLLRAMDRPDSVESNLRVAAVSAAAELVTASAPDANIILKQLLPDIVTRIEHALRIECLSNEDRENKDQMLGLLSGLVTALFQKLGKEDVLPHADRVMTAMLQIFQNTSSNCVEEAFLAVGAIATNLEDDFAKYLGALMPPLIKGLRSFNAQQLFIVSVGVVVDICGAVGNKVQPYCDQIMEALTECLRDSSVNRETKPVVFSCFGDIAMAIGAAFDPYIQVASMLLMQAAAAPVQPDDEDLMDFINRLRLSILDAYTGMIMGLGDGKVLHLFLPHVASVMQFLDYLSKPTSYKDDMCLQKAVALVGDIAHEMGSDPNIKHQVSQPFVLSLLQEALESDDGSTREIALWTQGVLRRLGA